MIEVENLTKVYEDFERGPFTAVDGIDFRVIPGEIFALLGQNGAGKTTILRILATMLQPTSGIVRVNGFNVLTESKAVRRCIGYVSSGTAVYDRMTGWEMVGHFGQLYGLSKSVLYPRMEELFDRLRMQDTRDVLGNKMSSGMKQKVSIARALIHDPPVLIFDEPTVGLDVLVARTLLKSIAELRNQGKCIIFSTHIMREVERICDRVAILSCGKILTQGTLEELRSQYHEVDVEEIFFRLIEKTL